MKRVTWNKDVVYIVRSPSVCPNISVGNALTFVAEHGTSERTCIKALQRFTVRGNIFRAAAFLAPYCIHPSIANAKKIFYALSFPFDSIQSPTDISEFTSLEQLDNYINVHGIIEDRVLIYKWVLAYTSLQMSLARILIQKIRPQPTNRVS